MKITIIGASAGTGLLCVQQALHKNHRVTTLSRNTDSIPDHPSLVKIKGSAADATAVRNAIKDADAVIVAIGTGKSTKPTTIYTEAAAALIQAQKELSTNIPFIILTGFGAGNSSRYQNLFMKIIFSLLLKAVYKNKTQMEEMIASSGMKWELVRPGVLNNNPYSGKYRIETTYKKGMKTGGISRADIADFLIKQAEAPTLPGQYPALFNL